MKARRRVPSWLLVGGGCAAVGLLETILFDLPESSRRTRVLFEFQRRGFLQVGLLLLLVGLVGVAMRRFRPGFRDRLSVVARRMIPRLALAFAMFWITGEVVLRVVFPEGLSFGTGAGPLTRRFMRDFRLNGYPGPGRGPEVRGAKQPLERRILVQGDSITWGQGVRREEDLYTTRLLALLQEQNPHAGVAAVCFPGREIDGHLRMLEKIGRDVDPDAVVYQWYVNDCELAKQDRPGTVAPWRKVFFWPLLCETSYLGFLIDFQLERLAPAPETTYEDYLRARFETDTPEWAEFASRFRAWAAAARRLTPRVLVMLYPHVGPGGFQVGAIHAHMRELCREEGLEVLDLIEAFPQATDDPSFLATSSFDYHPSDATHARIATVLHERLLRLWPELAVASADR